VSRSDLLSRIPVVEEGIVSRLLALVVLCSIGIVDGGYAQSRPVVEFEGGGGYVFGGGTEDPGPSLPTLDATIVVWPASRWGLAVRLVEGPGEDLHLPIESLDRTSLGSGHLRYWTVTARYRRPLQRDLGVEVGFGKVFGGEFATVQVFHNPPRRVSTADTFFGGLSLEALVGRGLARHFAMKAGLTYDFNFETANLQPVVLGVVGF
jgi:hypothetical protein